MKYKYFFTTLVVVFIVVGVLFGLTNTPVGLAASADSQQAQASDKIEAELLNQFDAEGQADFVVRFVEQADLSPAYSMDWDTRGQFVVDALTAAAEGSQAEAKALLDAQGLSYQTFIAGNELYVWSGDLNAATELAALPDVDYIRETRTYYIDPVGQSGSVLLNITWVGDLLARNAMVTTVEAQTEVGPEAPNALAWGIVSTNADQFWATFGLQGLGIKVANIDTGVQWDHPALDQSFACPGDPSNPACWADPSNICGGSACDNNGHGTHTMGSMVGDDDPALTYQAGMAPDASWIACKGCEFSSCSDYALNTCADWILQPGGNPANRPHIVNNSWGGSGCDTWYLTKVNAWRAAGTFPAFSAGNAGPGCSTLGSPGIYQESFSSGGHDVNDNIYTSSSRGPATGACDPHTPYTKPNISAPAVSVCSSVPVNGWSCGYSGTSMASPHSAGAVALLWSCNPSLIGQMDLTFEALQDTADTPPTLSCGVPPDGEGNYDFGYGYLNVLAAGIANCGGVDVGWLDGYVYDAGTGSPIEGASVMAVPGMLDGNTIEATTDPTGYYTMTLPVGTYDVTASKVNYTPQTVTGVVINLGTVTSQDFEIEYQGSWTPGPSNPPFQYNRFDGVFNPADELIYFLGGRTGGASHDRSIWTYDPLDDVWADTTCDMNQYAANITIALINDDGTGRGEALYVVGGYDVYVAANINVVQRYYPSEPGCIVEDVTTDPYPDTVSGQIIGAGGVGVVNDKIYVFGGWENITAPYFSNKTWEFDPLAPAASRWSEIVDATLTPPRAYLSSAVQNGLIYAMGGHISWDGSDLVPTNVVEVFDPANPGAGWVSLTSMPVATAEGRGFGFDADTLYGINQPWAGKIYVAGGGDWPSQSAEAMEYDVGTDTWDQAFPDLIAARRNHAGVFVPICTEDPTDGMPGMWVFGGNIGADDPPFGDPEFFPFPCEVAELTKTGPETATTGEVISYTIHFNAVEPIIGMAVLTDVLPAGVDFVSGTLTATFGTAWYDAVDNAVYWDGTMSPLGSAQNLPSYVPPTIVADLSEGVSYSGGGYQVSSDSNGISAPTPPERYRGPDALTFYSDRGAFDADFPGLPVEGFENTLVPPGGVVACPGPFDSNTNNACFAPGGIMDGIAFDTSVPGNQMVVLGAGFIGNPSVWIGPNTFVDDHDIFLLDGNIREVGFSLYSPIAADNYDIYIYGPGDVLIGQTVVFADASGVFFGVFSDDEPITRIRTVAQVGSGELVDDVAFGAVALAPNMVTIAFDVEVTATGGWVTNAVDLDFNGVMFSADTAFYVSSADLEVSKAAPASVYPGDVVTYTLAVANNGPDNATGVTLEDTLPAGVTFVSASAGCVEAGGVVTCYIGALAYDTFVPIEIVVTADTTGMITNVADVYGAEPDPDMGNNTASADTTVIAEADLDVVKTAPTSVYVGEDITYMIDVTNNGPEDASGVTLVDTLPAGVTFVSASVGCVEAGGVVTCDIGDLVNGASASVEIVVTAPGSAGAITNSAEVYGTEEDPDMTNNTTSADTTVMDLPEPTEKVVYLPIISR